MANYTATEIKALRERTGAGMLDVKKALDEADGDLQKAQEIIRVKGLKGVTKREGRATAEGLVAARVEGTVGYMVEVNSETDFVAKSAPFVEFGNKVLDAAVAADATTLESLMDAQVDGKAVSELVTETGALLGEKVVVRRIARVEGDNVAVYLHKTSKDLPAQVGVLLAVAGADAGQVAHDVAVHIAAMSPTFLSQEDVPAETVESEKRVAEETARAEGKPEKILPNIINGRLKGYFKDVVLLDQDFAKDSKKTVGKVLEEAGATATAFARFRVGA
ncbi:MULTISPECIES: translation elongation factor Ts [Kocuria]|jgi:elongation factor Ts|uniref:translation elongation factor Ts n=1 Tax=Kocuria TaxID=57493 RepID=UPI0003628C69|nr:MULTISPECIES: translation elongation factor Ts [Kocuria]MCC5782182.1 elongation factor Ts [Kocuria sp. CCUG 69068]EYT48874.1 elongation factor Ts [Kocuria sp. UCD-OTCP]MCM3486419.1 translation elongation factor Ts [Kocuria rosea]MEB2527505.1 translation elongation factor Ts [Kocuria rosea]MEB2617283.1 translation elongation factor Ts [Kocuria rosea]